MAVEDYPGIWRYVIVIVSMVELLWFSGIMYGWGALVYVLKDEGFLEELCHMGNSTLGPNNIVTVKDCAMRDARFNLYFTLISSIGVLLILVVGHTFTRFGTRTTRLVFITSFGAGCLFVAFADTDVPWLVCLGGTLMIGSGYVFIITSTQFNMLFPGHSSTIVGIMNGMKVSSSFMQQLVKIAYDNGIGRRTSYFVLFGLTLLTYLSTIFLYPKDILKDKEKNKEINANIDDKEKNTDLHVNGISKESCTLGQSCKENTESKETTLHHAINLCNERDDCSLQKKSNAIANGVNAVLVDDRERIPKCNNNDEEVIDKKACIPLCNNGNTMLLADAKRHTDSLEKASAVFVNGGFVNDNLKENTHALPGHVANVNGLQGVIDKAQKLDIGSVNDGQTVLDKQQRDIQSSKGIGKNEKSQQNTTPLKQDHVGNELRTNMCGYLYLFNVLWFTVIRFRTNYFYGTINPFIEEVTHNNEEKVSYYTDILSYSMASGILTCICVGVLYDWQRRFFIGIENIKTRRVMSSVSPLITTCLVSVLLSSLVFVKDEMVVYPLTIIFTFFRSLLTTVGNTFLVDMFPASIYGTIYGTRFVIANVFSLIQYALYQWSLGYDGAGHHVNLFVLLLCLTTFIHPVSILLANRRKKTKEVTHL